MASLEEIRNTRLEKLQALDDAGVARYPISSKRTKTLAVVDAEFSKLKSRKNLSLAGRVMAIRGSGGISFVSLHDGTGLFQAVFKKDTLNPDLLERFKSTLDIGDIISVSGTLFMTKTNQKSIEVKDWTMLVKSLRPLPEKWHGLQDPDERFRRRYLDALMDEAVKERFVVRSHIVSALRGILDGEGFIEVETPILQPLAGGASAEPFKTHHNALDMDLYLRIAPELYLKEMIVAGFPKVYEIGRSFRNEGIDATHNPEFTTLELYEAYEEAEGHMKFLEKVLKTLVKKVTGTTEVTFEGKTINFGEPFVRVKFLDLFKTYAGLPHAWNLNASEIRVEAMRLGAEIDKGDTKAKIFDKIYKKVIRPKLIQPTYIVDYPAEFSPLAKRREDIPELIDRYQLVVGGIEIVNAFSELNDPLDQRSRFAEQEKNKVAGDTEAQPMDESFIEALEYGMPPTAGLGLSIDRLTMLLTDTHNIKEVIFFPTMRPKN